MNVSSKILLFLALATACGSVGRSQPPQPAPAKPAAPRSVFAMPTNPREGRDPFFPESTRPYEEAAPQHPETAMKALAVKGISWEHGRAMVIINNHTFAIGDEGEVLTPGGRVHLRLADIRRDAVVVEVNGSRRELTITK